MPSSKTASDSLISFSATIFGVLSYKDRKNYDSPIQAEFLPFSYSPSFKYHLLLTCTHIKIQMSAPKYAVFELIDIDQSSLSVNKFKFN